MPSIEGKSSVIKFPHILGFACRSFTEYFPPATMLGGYEGKKVKVSDMVTALNNFLLYHTE